MHLRWNTAHPSSALPDIFRAFVAGWGALRLTYAIRSFISLPVNWGHCPRVLVIGAIIDPAWLNIVSVQAFESEAAAILDSSGAAWPPVPPTEWQRTQPFSLNTRWPALGSPARSMLLAWYKNAKMSAISCEFNWG